LAERRVDDLVLRLVPEHGLDDGDEHHQQREDREERVVGDLGRQSSLVVGLALLHRRHGDVDEGRTVTEAPNARSDHRHPSWLVRPEGLDRCDLRGAPWLDRVRLDGRSSAMATWMTFRTEAPDLAAVIQGRFTSHLHHILATLRADGSPRVSG